MMQRISFSFVAVILICAALCYSQPSNRQSPSPLTCNLIDPWSVSREAGQFDVLGPMPETIAVSAFQNEVVVRAIALQAETAVDVDIVIKGDRDTSVPLELAVLGEVLIKHGGEERWIPDALITRPAAMGDLTSHVRNWPDIRDFPRLHLRPERPVILWLAMSTYDVPSGRRQTILQFTRADSSVRQTTIDLTIHPIALPRDNPIIGHTWTTYRENVELARAIRTYGINACGYYDDWDMLRREGFRFFRFSFSPSNGLPESLAVKDEEVLYYIDSIKDTIARLQLKPEEWALEIFDEPFDALAWMYVAWAARIRHLWPEARFWANPGFSATNKNFATIPGTINPMKSYVDVWCPFVEYLHKPEIMAALRETGKPLWYYTIEFAWQKPAAGGRNLPWKAWIHRLDGWSFYCLKDYGEAPWSGDHCARMYPGNTMSVWMEGLRQGVGDYKRVWLLEQGGLSREEIIGVIRGQLRPGEDSPWGGADPPTYEKIRARMDELILSARLRSDVNSNF